MPFIEDPKLGRITVRRSSRSHSLRATLGPDGNLRVSVPSLSPLFVVKRMIASMRPDLQKLLDSRPKIALYDGMQIGKSHTLVVKHGPVSSIKRTGNQLIATVTNDQSLTASKTVDEIRSHMRTIARREAKQYLPRRLSYLAEQHGFTYSTLRFTHASSRWGSCSSNKTISLNIALMNLPHELIDYVLIHELAHTVEMNHSAVFWDTVAEANPTYKLHRKSLKSYSPTI